MQQVLGYMKTIRAIHDVNGPFCVSEDKQDNLYILIFNDLPISAKSIR